MRTHSVLLHTFAVLLLCDYGMFSTPSPFTFENPMNISNPNMTTAESTTINDQTTESQDYSGETADYNETSDSSLERSTNATELVSSTARQRSTTALVAAAPKKDSGGKQAGESGGQYAGGVIILIFILILIAVLLGLLYFLRKKGRSYSFDLNRVDGPANDYDTPLRSDQQGISYEQTNKDLPVCLDYIQEEKSEEKMSPMTNGCPAEKTPASENEEPNVPEENSFSSTSSLTPPLKKVEFNLDLDLIGESDFNNPAPSEADDADQNENNNAGRGTAEEIFTEVSLDEPKEV